MPTRSRPPYVIFATHYADVLSFADAVRGWDPRDPARNVAKALEFARLHAEMARRCSAPGVQVVYVDSSPLDLGAFLRDALPALAVEVLPADAGGTSAADLVCLRFADNIGHLSVHGRDGWGRSCMRGLAYALDAGYELAVHVEADLLARGPGWIERAIAGAPDAALWSPRMHLGVETGLFVARTAWLREARFVERYDWRTVAGRPRPEERFTQIAGDAWAPLAMPGGRGEEGGAAALDGRAGDAYLTHATAAEWVRFLDVAGHPVPDSLRLVAATPAGRVASFRGRVRSWLGGFRRTAGR